MKSKKATKQTRSAKQKSFPYTRTNAVPQFSPRTVSASTRQLSTLGRSSPGCVAQPGKAEVGAMRDPGASNINMVGIQAQMTTLDPWIACQNETGSSVAAFSQAHASLYLNTGSWAQIGWVKRRKKNSNGSYSVVRNSFVEIVEPGVSMSDTQQFFTAPSLDENWTYILTLNPNTGYFTASAVTPSGAVVNFDLTQFNAIYHVLFINKKYQSAQWAGETLDLGSYMPGFSNARCQFINCQYLNTGSTEWSSVGWFSLSYIPASGTDTNSAAHIPVLGSVDVEVWDTRNPH